MRKDITAFNGMRGIFAFLIFVSHFPFNTSLDREVFGEMGVSFFFILSGFLMSASHMQSVENHTLNFRQFMYRRFIKLWPLHMFCLLLYIIEHNMFGHIAMGPLVLNILMLQSWVPEIDWFFSYNGVAWFVADIMFCYAMYPLLQRFNIRQRKYFGVAVVGACVAEVVIGSQLPQRLYVPLLYVSPLFRLIDFAIGMAMYGCTMTVGRSMRHVRALQAVAVGVVIVAVPLWYELPEWVSLVALWYAPMALLIYSFGRAAVTPLASFFSCRLFTFVGRVSMPMFLLQLIVIYACTHILNFMPTWLLFITTSCVLIAVSALIQRVIEKQNKELNKKLN